MKDLDSVSKALKAAGWSIIAAEIRYVAKNFADVRDAARKEVEDFLNSLDDHDDVHRVYAAIKWRGAIQATWHSRHAATMWFPLPQKTGERESLHLHSWW